ncbi:hypothetical protein HBI91_052420 [Parastagonospora nodorum]|nr:hypothetical protein HBI91_052420 [Parastagonospora nodorum]
MSALLDIGVLLCGVALSPAHRAPSPTTTTTTTTLTHTRCLDAVKAVVQSGMFVAVSAGNEFGDARDVSPASEPSVCTVGATTINDTIAEFSNTGPVVDILAPGVDVLSTWNNGSTAVISGTSMSAPHVAGLGAYLLGAGLAEVESLCETIKGLALKNVIMLLPNGTANLLANNGVDQDGERQPQDPKPTYGLH